MWAEGVHILVAGLGDALGRWAASAGPASEYGQVWIPLGSEILGRIVPIAGLLGTVVVTRSASSARPRPPLVRLLVTGQLAAAATIFAVPVISLVSRLGAAPRIVIFAYSDAGGRPPPELTALMTAGRDCLVLRLSGDHLDLPTPIAGVGILLVLLACSRVLLRFDWGGWSGWGGWGGEPPDQSTRA